MADFTLDITELQDMAERIGQIAEQGALPFMQDAVRFRNLVMQEARRIVPVDTGALQRSIQPTHTEASQASVSAEFVVGEGYAGFVEFGTVRMRAQPFIRPALSRYRDDYREAIIERAKEQFGTLKKTTRPGLATVPGAGLRELRDAS